MPDDTDIIVDLLLEYLEALVNQILYLRQIYDRDIFQRERLYGIAVHRSRHPELTVYIAESLSSLREAFKQCVLKKVGIRIKDPGGQVKERFVFSLEAASLDGIDPRNLEVRFRAMLLKLQYADSCMRALPNGCTFEIESHVSEEESLPIEMWVEGSTALPNTSQLKSIVPIKSATIGNALKFQLHAEIC